MATKDDLITRERLEAAGWKYLEDHDAWRKGEIAFFHDDGEYWFSIAQTHIYLTTMTQLSEIEDFIKRFKSQQP